jgi:hypothetical protein
MVQKFLPLVFKLQNEGQVVIGDLMICEEVLFKFRLTKLVNLLQNDKQLVVYLHVADQLQKGDHGNRGKAYGTDWLIIEQLRTVQHAIDYQKALIDY